VVAGAACGAVVPALAVIGGASWSVAALFAEDVAALVFLVWFWSTIAAADAPATSRLARTEDASRTSAEAGPDRRGGGQAARRGLHARAGGPRRAA
jgi:hypothetical protein